MEATGLDFDIFAQDMQTLDKSRGAMADHLEAMSNLLADSDQSATAETINLPELKEALKQDAAKLREGTYRLLVLGDMKRGKSTFLNALLGQDLLPAAINPCTAIITVLRYGATPSVIVEHTADSGKAPANLTFDQFKKGFTIPLDKAEEFTASGTKAFPDVKQAVVCYPLDLLQNKVEIVDSPGLNEDEDREAITFSYLPNTHAVLFMLSASESITLRERNYLTSTFKDRGLTVFFIINRWNLLAQSVLDTADPEALSRLLEERRAYFKNELRPYTTQNGQDIYASRVFEINALGALQGRLAGHSLDDMVATGVPQFVGALDIFLMVDRGRTELQQVLVAGKDAVERVEKSVAMRLPNLSLTLDEVKAKIDEVQPQFDQLTQIKQKVGQRINKAGRDQAQAAGDSFETMFDNLHATFDVDFARIAGDFPLQELVTAGGRAKLDKVMQANFEQYLTVKYTEWMNGPFKNGLAASMDNLTHDLNQYGTSYKTVTDDITDKIAGVEREYNHELFGEVVDTKSPAWTRWAAAAGSFMVGDFAGAVMGGALGWKASLANFGLLVGVAALVGIFGIALGPIGVAVVAAAIATGQLARLKHKVLASVKAKFSEELPQVAKANRPKIEENVQAIYDKYQNDVETQIQKDIDERRNELDGLLTIRKERELDVEKVKTALQTILDGDGTHLGIHQLYANMETVYNEFVGGGSIPKTLQASVSY